MARRVQTVERTWTFDLSEAGEDIVYGTKYIDVAQVHALGNRFAVRQGHQFMVESIEIGCVGGASFSATIYRLPSHWPAINAWEKSFHHWDEQQRDMADEAGTESRRARYRDFKVFFDATHAQSGVGANLIPSGFSVTAPASGGYDWSPAQVVVPNDGGVPGNTQEYYLHMLGPDQSVTNNSKGLINAYAESRARPLNDDPNIVDVTSGGLFGEMVDVGETANDLTDNWSLENDQPPYLLDVDTAQEFYPGGSLQGIGPLDGGGITHPGVMVDVLSIGASQNFNSDTCGSFVAPCGLIKVEYRATGVNPLSPPTPGMPPMTFWLKLRMSPGYYKGLAAQSMQEAN